MKRRRFLGVVGADIVAGASLACRTSLFSGGRIVSRASMLSGASAIAGGCALGPNAAQPALYDFGLDPAPAPAQPLRARVALAEVSANSWLQSPAIVYRLAYRDPAQLLPYSLSRWAAPPAELLTQRLRDALGHAAENGFSMVAECLSADYLLRVHLEAFEQVVDTPTASRALVRMRARLSSAQRKPRAQRLFQSERPCSSVDAAGSVHALKAAADAAILQMIDWVVAETA
jgi:cholesterol transport system auxiliary component